MIEYGETGWKVKVIRAGGHREQNDVFLNRQPRILGFQVREQRATKKISICSSR